MSVPVLDQRSELTGNHLWENLASPFRATFSVGKKTSHKTYHFSAIGIVGGRVDPNPNKSAIGQQT